MSADSPDALATPEPVPTRRSSGTRFFLRGLAIVLPAILTVVILIWIAGIVSTYIISPISYGVRYVIAQGIDNNTRPTESLVYWDKLPSLEFTQKNYRLTPEFQQQLEDRWNADGDHRTADGRLPAEVPLQWVLQQVDSPVEKPQVFVPFGQKAVPYRDYRTVARNVPLSEIPGSATGVYMEYVTIKYFGSQFLLSAGAVSIAIVALYFIGRLVTVRIGAWFVHRFETLVLGRLPVISTVYSAVKQVTDFLFSERQIEYNRVVAIEYPRRGIWSIGFVTGNSMLELTGAAGEPLVSVLIPTSPMPVTGYTMSVPRRDVMDLNITIDQAFQFCVSCGVLVPPTQQVTPESLQRELAKRLTANLDADRHREDGKDRPLANTNQSRQTESPAQN